MNYFITNVWKFYVSMKILVFKHMHLCKESICSAGDTDDAYLIPGSERSPGTGNGNALQYSCLKNPTDRGAWRVTVNGIANSQTWPSDWTQTLKHTYIYVCVYVFSVKRGRSTSDETKCGTDWKYKKLTSFDRNFRGQELSTYSSPSFLLHSLTHRRPLNSLLRLTFLTLLRVLYVP